MAHAIVLGGGFGGLAAARRLRELLPAEDEVTVVARDDRFFMGFAKLWALSGQRPLDEGTRSLRRLEPSGITFLHAEVRSVDPDARTIATSAGSLTGDGIVVALGAAPPTHHREMLAGEASFDLYDPASLEPIRDRLIALDEGRVVLSILGGPFKCPPAPYEAALIVERILAEAGPRARVEVTLTTPQPLTLPAAGVDASRFIADRLDEGGVEVRTERHVAAVDHERSVVTFEGGEELAFDLLLGIPADAPLPPVADGPLSDDDGWLRPDPGTFALGHERLYAVGDATVIPTPLGALPHAGVFAAAGGEIAATNLAADLHGGDRARFDGHGHCFLELPDEQVAVVEGDFYADPPAVMLTPPSREQFEAKLAFERDRLDRWLP